MAEKEKEETMLNLLLIHNASGTLTQLFLLFSLELFSNNPSEPTKKRLYPVMLPHYR